MSGSKKRFAFSGGVNPRTAKSAQTGSGNLSSSVRDRTVSESGRSEMTHLRFDRSLPGLRPPESPPRGPPIVTRLPDPHLLFLQRLLGIQQPLPHPTPQSPLPQPTPQSPSLPLAHLRTQLA